MGQKRRRKLSRKKNSNTDESGSESSYTKEDPIDYGVNVEESSEDESADDEGDASETRAMRELVLQQNRKKKKSGGFQSMGTRSGLNLTCVAVTCVKTALMYHHCIESRRFLLSAS